MTVLEQIEKDYLIPVTVIDDAERAFDAAKAIMAGGLNVMEITLRTGAALDAIENAVKAGLYAGAGTVLSLDQCREAVSRGASFIVSPGYDPEIVEYCQKTNVIVFPGCVTPTEITGAIKAGVGIVKFFPASVYGGGKAIKALSGPFPHVRFIPTGGIDSDNLKEFIMPQVFAIGGGWLCDRKALNSGDYEGITRTCVKSLELASGLRKASRDA